LALLCLFFHFGLRAQAFLDWARSLDARSSAQVFLPCATSVGDNRFVWAANVEGRALVQHRDSLGQVLADWQLDTLLIPLAIETDAQGRVYLAAMIQGHRRISPSHQPSHWLNAPNGGWSLALIQYQANGQVAWAQLLNLDLSNQFHYLFLRLKISDQGWLALSGSFSGTVDLDPSPAVFSLSAQGTADGFLAQYNSSNGGLRWAFRLGGHQADRLTALALDTQGNLYAAGYFRDSLDADPSANTFWLRSQGAGDICLLRYRPNGQLDWAFSLGSTGEDEADALGFSPQGKVWLAGRLAQANTDLDPSLALAPAGGTLFLAQYDPLGQYERARAWTPNHVNDRFLALGQGLAFGQYQQGVWSVEQTLPQGTGIFALGLDSLLQGQWQQAIQGLVLDAALFRPLCLPKPQGWFLLGGASPQLNLSPSLPAYPWWGQGSIWFGAYYRRCDRWQLQLQSHRHRFCHPQGDSIRLALAADAAIHGGWVWQQGMLSQAFNPSGQWFNQSAWYSIRPAHCPQRLDQGVFLQAAPVPPRIQASNPRPCPDSLVNLWVNPIATHYWWNGQAGTAFLGQQSAGWHRLRMWDSLHQCQWQDSLWLPSGWVSVDTVLFFPIANTEAAAPLDSLLMWIFPDSLYALPRQYRGQGVSWNIARQRYELNAQGLSPGLHPLEVLVQYRGCWHPKQARIMILPPPQATGLPRFVCSSDSVLWLHPATNYPYRFEVGQPSVEWYRTELQVQAYQGQPLAQGNVQQPQYRFEVAHFGSNPVVVEQRYYNTAYYYSPIPPFPLLRQQRYLVAHTRDTIWRQMAGSARILSRDSVYCLDSFYRAFQAQPQGGTWTVWRAGQLIQQNAQQTFFARPSDWGAGSLDLRYVVWDSGCWRIDSLSVLIPALPDARFQLPNGQTSFCQNDSAQSILVNRSGGLFSGASNTALLQPSQLSVGIHPLRYTVWDGYGCRSDHQLDVEIRPLPLLQWSVPSPRYCTGDTAGLWLQAQGLGQTHHFRWSGRQGQQQCNSSACFWDLRAWLGTAQTDTVLVQYQTTNVQGCSQEAHRLVVLNANPSMAWNQALPPLLCQGAQTLPVVPNRIGGQWSVVSTTNNFDPMRGLYQPLQATVQPEVLTYRWTDTATGCAGQLLDTVSVLANVQQASWTQRLPAQVCPSQDTLWLSVQGLPVGTQPQVRLSSAAVWFWSGSQHLGIVASGLSAGLNVLELSYATTGGCWQYLYDTVWVVGQPSVQTLVNAQAVRQFCQHSGTQVLGLALGAGVLPSAQMQWLAPASGQWNADSMAVGWHGLRLRYRDGLGCWWEHRDSLEVLANPFPLLSGLEPRYCVGQQLADTLIGLPLGGQWFSNLPQQPTQPHLSPLASYAVFLPQVAGQQANQIRIGYEVQQVNGCRNRIEQLAILQPAQVVQFTNPQAGAVWCANRGDFHLRVNVNGVADSTGRFLDWTGQTWQVASSVVDPQRLGLRRYAYVTDAARFGCSDTGQVVFTIQPKPQASVRGFSPSYCVGTLADTVWSQNLSLDQRFWTNRTTAAPAWFVPQTQQAGPDTLWYRVADAQGCADTLVLPFTVRPSPRGLGIVGLQAHWCENEPLRVLDALPMGNGSWFVLQDMQGRGLDSQWVNFPFLPARYGPGQYRLALYHRDTYGCQAMLEDTFWIHPKPRAAFAQQRFCAGDSVVVQDQSTLPIFALGDRLVAWQWRYQGSVLLPDQPRRPVWPATQAGWGIMELVVSSDYGCRDTLRSGQGGDTIFVYHQPQVSWQTAGGCQGDTLWFSLADSVHVPSDWQGIRLNQLTQVIWDFGDGQQRSISPQQLYQPQPHRYTQAGRYRVQLLVGNRQHCFGQDTQVLIVPARIPITDWDGTYSIDFGQSAQHWQAQRGIWQWSRALGQQLWQPSFVWSVRGAQPYEAGDQDWLYAPCFDLRYARRPMLEFDWQADLYPFDGVALQYYDEQTNPQTGLAWGWRHLGQAERGWAWYNAQQPIFGMFSLYGSVLNANLTGWTGSTARGDWQRARYSLSNFRGASKPLRLRFALSTLPGLPNTEAKEGFILRNFAVRERNQKVLMEYFTSLNRLEHTAERNNLYQRFVQEDMGQDLAFVQYHRDDAWYNFSPSSVNARRFYYGAEQGDLLVQGNAFQGKLGSLPAWLVEKQSLLPAKVQLDLLPLLWVAGQGLRLRLVVRILEDLPLDDYQVQLALQVDSLQGDQRVLVQWLMEHGAWHQRRAWRSGDSLVLDQFFALAQLPMSVLPQHLVLTAWMERGSAKEVLQVEHTKDLDWLGPLGLEALSALNWRLYPNPAQDWLVVEGTDGLEDWVWTAVDVLGRVWPLSPQAGRFELGQLPPGIYWLCAWRDGQLYWRRQWFKQ
jgi:hypothetical protein